MFKIEDEIHAEPQRGEFETFDQAMEELKRRANIAWDMEPNRCPCKSWKTCERQYQIIEYDDTNIPWKELEKRHILTISSKGIQWDDKIKTSYNID